MPFPPRFGSLRGIRIQLVSYTSFFFLPQRREHDRAAQRSVVQKEVRYARRIGFVMGWYKLNGGVVVFLVAARLHKNHTKDDTPFHLNV